MRVGIVGLGLIGASLAMALRGAFRVLGTDRDRAVLEAARSAGLVEPGDPLAADVVVLAVPIPTLPSVLPGLRGHPGVVTDVASTKVQVMAWARRAGVDLIGGHPMCGSERSGFTAADGSLFVGAPWVLTRAEPRLEAVIRATGAEPVVMDAERHDRLVAGVSHAAFCCSAAYVLALAGDPEWPEARRLAGPGFRDLSRLAAGDPSLHLAILGTNREPVVERLRALERELARVRELIEAGEAKERELRQLLERARRERAPNLEAVGHGG
jgi:prephenate dehydrogenase